MATVRLLRKSPAIAVEVSKVKGLVSRSNFCNMRKVFFFLFFVFTAHPRLPARLHHLFFVSAQISLGKLKSSAFAATLYARARARYDILPVDQKESFSAFSRDSRTQKPIFLLFLTHANANALI